MDNLEVSKFVGLDLRRLPEATSPRALRYAKNVHVSRGQGLAARGPFRRVAVVDSASRGLYVVNDTLRCALPYPAGVVPRPPLNITYDLLCDVGGGFAGTLDSVADVTSWDSRPYICAAVPSPGGGLRYRHYFVPATQSAMPSGIATNPTGTTVDIVGAPAELTTGGTIWFFGWPGAYLITNRVGDTFTFAALPALGASTSVVGWAPLSNRVSLPFEPGPAVETAEGHIWAPNQIDRVIQYSSTVNGPTDWTSVGDAGFINTPQYPGGDQPCRALAIFNRQLVVFYSTALQIWNIDPDPQNISFFSYVGGTGSNAPGSVANIHGDLLYLADGVFASLNAVITTGQPKAGNVYGEPIAELTAALDRLAAAEAIWASKRQQYICAVDDEILVFTFAPNDADEAAIGWGRWEAPWPISDIVEWRGDVYVRRADQPEIWKLEPDGGESPHETVEWGWHTGFADFQASGYGKAIRALDLHARGVFTLATQSDPTGAEPVIDLGEINVTTNLGGLGKMMVILVADMIQLQASGEGAMAIDGFTWRFKGGGLL